MATAPIAKSVVMGLQALKQPTAIADSVVIGSEAGKAHQRGERNILVGKAAGYAASGSDNIYIGTATGSSTVGSGNILVGSGVGDATCSNTLVIGRGSVRPIAASLETGKVTLSSTHIEGDLTYSGTIHGQLPPNVVRTLDNNVGSHTQSLTGSYLVAFGSHTGTTGTQNVFLGTGAGRESTLHHTIAVGELAAAHASGSNIIAIGERAGFSTTKSDSLYIGDYLDADSDTLRLHRTLSVAGWTVQHEKISSSNILLRPGRLKLGDLVMTSLPDGDTVVSSSLHVHAKPAVQSVRHALVQSHGILYLDGQCVRRTGFKTLFEWLGGFVGLDASGHLYTSKTGQHWFPLRSPPLTHVTPAGRELFGWTTTGSFVTYDGQDWTTNARDDGEYACTTLCGNYAFGSPLSNPFYEDSGTILFRVGSEWRLYPGVYPDQYTHCTEAGGEVFVGNAMGLYRLEQRQAILVKTGEVTAMAGKFVAMGSSVYSLPDLHLVRTYDDASVVFLDRHGNTVTTRGAYTHTGDLVEAGTTITHLFLISGTRENPNLSVPSRFQVGTHQISSSKRGGLDVTDGVYTGTLYDTTFNPIPIRLDGFTSLTVKKCPSTGGILLIGGCDDGRPGSTHTQVSLRSSHPPA